MAAHFSIGILAHFSISIYIFRYYFNFANSTIFHYFVVVVDVDVAKLLQKSEMRKDIVIELSYKGFS